MRQTACEMTSGVRAGRYSPSHLGPSLVFPTLTQTPAPIPPRLLAHGRRWKARNLIASHFVEYNGKANRVGEKGL
jgi:hypothetical protein